MIIYYNKLMTGTLFPYHLLTMCHPLEMTQTYLQQKIDFTDTAPSPSSLIGFVD